MKKLLTLVLFLAALIPSYAQIDIRHFEGSWFISEVKEASENQKPLEASDLEFLLENMQQGYFHITSTTMDFIFFDGSLEIDIAEGMNYTYNPATKEVELRSKETDLKSEEVMKLITITSTSLVYQVSLGEHVVEFNFVRAKPEDFIIANWGVSEVEIPEYMATLTSDEDIEQGLVLQQLLFQSLSFWHFEFYRDFGYLEFPDENNETISSEFEWTLEANQLVLNHADGTVDYLTVVSLAHNEFTIILPAEGMNMVVSFKRY